MTLQEFLSNQERLIGINSFLRSSDGQALISFLEETCQRPKAPKKAEDVNPQTVAIALGETIGAWGVIDTMKKIGEPTEQELAKHIESTFGVDPLPEPPKENA